MRQMTLTGGTITFPTDLDIITDQREKKLQLLSFKEAGLWPQHISIVANIRSTNLLVPFLMERLEAPLQGYA